MDPAIVVAGIAAVPAIIGGALGAWAGLKQRGNENLTITITAMQQHMTTLSTENVDLRIRVRNAEERSYQSDQKFMECEAKRIKLEHHVENLERRFDAAEARNPRSEDPQTKSDRTIPRRN